MSAVMEFHSWKNSAGVWDDPGNVSMGDNKLKKDKVHRYLSTFNN